MKKSLFVFLCCLAFLAFETKGTWAALPQTWCVDNATDLQNALTTAQGNGLANVIMVVQGMYTGNFTYNSSSGLSITLQGGYTAGCVSQVFNPAKTVLNGNHSGVVLSLFDSNGGSISVEEFTIRNGNNITTGNGGGVYAQSNSGSGTGGTITLSGNTFTGNTAARGGGIWAESSSGSGAGGPITFQWNTFTGNYAYNDGGGVYAESSGETGSGEIYFYENTIKGNYAYTLGGGVYASSSSNSGTGGAVSLMENTITGNYGYFEAGGVYAYSYSESGTGGTIALTQNTISGNTCYGETGGAGVYASSSSNSGAGAIALTQNTISGNTSYGWGAQAGGVYIYSYSYSGPVGTINLTGNTVANNQTYGYGGGVYCETDTYEGTTGAVTFEANTITGNTAYFSYGGVYAYASSSSGTTGAITFTNNIIAGNTSSQSFAGGVYAQSSAGSGTTGPITFTNNTITKNSAPYLYAGGIEVYTYNNIFNCYNNIIWGNTAPSAADIYLAGTGTAYGYNNDYNVLSGSWNGESGNINANPLFDKGGYYHLTSTSPCINAGDNSAPSLPATDIDGNNRVIGAAVDIGAVEYNRPLIAKGPANESSFGDLTFTNKYQPTFQWIAVEPFKSFEIVFATTSDFSSGIITTASVSGTKKQLDPSDSDVGKDHEHEL